MAGTVTTSLVVQFGEGTAEGQYHLSAEIDARPLGLNGGNTQFIGGDAPVFLVYKSSELALSFVTTQGGLLSQGSGQLEVEEWITFTNSKTAELSKPPVGTVVLDNYGGTAGATVVGSTVTLVAPGTAVYKATYQAKFYAYKMTSIPVLVNGDSDFIVVVVVTGVAV